MLILSWALGLAVALHVYFHVQSLQEFKEAHSHPFVLVGDSHADDVPWEDKPRFSGPAQDLFSSLKMVESLAATKDDRSDIQGIVFTFWPNKFSPLAEDRLSGNTQEDNWGQMAMGRVAPLMTWTDLWRSDVPLKFRLSMAWHTLQCKKTHAWWDVACEEQAVSQGYREGLGERMTSNNWWAEASVSPDLFEALVESVVAEGWHLVLVENPLHTSYYEQVNQEALQGYESMMEEVGRHPSGLVHRLAMGRDNQNHEWFRDYHHLTCLGEAHVKERLDALLESLASTSLSED